MKKTANVTSTRAFEDLPENVQAFRVALVSVEIEHLAENTRVYPADLSKETIYRHMASLEYGYPLPEEWIDAVLARIGFCAECLHTIGYTLSCPCCNS